MRPAVSKLLRFIEQPTCQDYLDMARETFFTEFAENHELKDFDSICETIGDSAMAQIVPCMLEFFFSNDYRDENGERWNVIDLFLRKRGTLLNVKDKSYLRSLRQSHMSLYEVIEIESEKSLVVRDLIGGGAPVRVFEKSLTRYVTVWNIIGARICSEEGRPVFAGGALAIGRETGIDLAKTIKDLHDEGIGFLRKHRADDPEFSAYSPAEHERLMKVMWAKEIGLGYLEECFEKLNRKIELRNSDGHTLQYHTITFPLNVNWNDIATQLNTVENYHQDEDSRARKFWNWIQPMEKNSSAHRKNKKPKNPQVRVIETTLEGAYLNRPVRVLGTLELLKSKLIVQANSIERTRILEKRVITLLESRIGEPTWRAEESISGLSAKERLPAAKTKNLPKPDITPEEETEILHTMLTEHYREWLVTPIPAFGGKTPRQMSKTKGGRATLVESLKSIEISLHHIERQSDITHPLDLGWLWEDLGINRDIAA